MLRTLVALCGLFAASSAHASIVSVTLGDNDCFGIISATDCDDGDVLSVPGPFDNSTAADPANTDEFGVLGQIDFVFPLTQSVLDTAVSASFFIKFFGLDLADNSNGGFGTNDFVGTRILLNGNDVGLYNPPAPAGGNAFISPTEVETFSVFLDTNDLGLVNTFTLIPEEIYEQFNLFENYAVDFANLTVELDTTPAPVPLPASSLLLLGGLGGLAAMRRRQTR